MNGLCKTVMLVQIHNKSFCWSNLWSKLDLLITVEEQGNKYNLKTSQLAFFFFFPFWVCLLEVKGFRIYSPTLTYLLASESWRTFRTRSIFKSLAKLSWLIWRVLGNNRYWLFLLNRDLKKKRTDVSMSSKIPISSWVDRSPFTDTKVFLVFTQDVVEKGQNYSTSSRPYFCLCWRNDSGYNVGGIESLL